MTSAVGSTFEATTAVSISALPTRRSVVLAAPCSPMGTDST